eukprot:TRINITY_DN1959_c0_g1_i1.p1 TRINITY_DN1959_c0_g1~~TRINITY_DN1959_c0_g1_i1.p1  ORF type:complete len:1522 (+),score=358.22 TRINITY_DN1959_c0_g1_i1:76-4566(+)
MSDVEDATTAEDDQILDDESGPTFYNPNGDELVEKSKQKSIEELLTPKRVFPTEKPWLKKSTPVREVKVEDKHEPAVHETQTVSNTIEDTPEHEDISPDPSHDTAAEEHNNDAEVSLEHAPQHSEIAIDTPVQIETIDEPIEESHDEDPGDVTEEYHEEPITSNEEHVPIHQDATPDATEELAREDNMPIHYEGTSDDTTNVMHEDLPTNDGPDQQDVAHEETESIITEDVVPHPHDEEVKRDEHGDTKEHEEISDNTHDDSIQGEETNHITDEPAQSHEDITAQTNETDHHDHTSHEENEHTNTETKEVDNEEQTPEKHGPVVIASSIDPVHHEVADEAKQDHSEELDAEPSQEEIEQSVDVAPEATHDNEPTVEESKHEKEAPAPSTTIVKPAASKLAKPKATGIPKISTTKTTATAAKSKISAPSPRAVTATSTAKKTAEKPATGAAKKSTTAAAKTTTKLEAKPKAEPAKPKTTTTTKPKEAATKVEPKAAKPKTPRIATMTTTSKVAPKAEKPKTPISATSTTTSAKASTTAATVATTKTATVPKAKETKAAPAAKKTEAAKAEKPKTPRNATSTASAKTTATKTEKPATSGTTVTAAKPKLTPVTVPSTAAAKTAPKPASVTTVTATKTEKPTTKPTTTATSVKPKETKPATAKAATKTEKPTTASAKAAAPKATAKKSEKPVASNTNVKSSATKAAPAKGAKATATKPAAKKTTAATNKTKAAPAKGAKNNPAKAGAKKSSAGSDGKTKAAAKSSGTTTTAAASGAVPKPGLTTARKPTGAQNRRKPTVNPIQGMKTLEQNTQQNKSNAPETPHKRLIQLRHVATPTSKEKLATFSLYKIQGRKVLIPEKVELKFQSLHVNCAFVLDTKDKIFIWYGPEANRMEKAFAVDFAKRLKDEDNMGRSQTFTIGECKEEIEDEFWNYLSPSGEIPSHEEKKDVKPAIHLYRVKDKIEQVEGDKFMKEVLNDLFCFVLDCPNEVYCWMGKNTSEDVRNKANEHAKVLLVKKKLKWVKVEKLLSGVPEPVSFKVKFANWGGRLPIATGPVAMPAPKKRVPLTKFDVNKLFNRPQKPKEAIVDDGSGKTLMWIVRRSENSEKVPLAKKDYGHFFSGESYLILYTYTIKNTEHKMIYFWQGRNSTVMDKGFSAVLTIDLDDKLGGEAKQVRVVQGKEPQHFLKIFGGLMVVHKGKYNAEENYLNKTKLYQLKGSFEVGTLLEVEPRLRNVNVNESMLLTTPLKTYFMRSPYNEISFNAEKLAWCKDTELIEFTSDELNDDFVDVLGLAGSGEKMYGETYPWVYSEGEESNSHQESWPILFQAQIVTGQFKMEEIFDFTQDDLLDRDVFVLDCKDTIWVWFGKNSVPILQQLTLETLLDYVDKHPMGERLGDPINIIKSGLEPLEFTVHFFGWEYAKNSNPQAYSASIRPMEEVLELIKKKYTYDELIKNTPEYCDKSKLELYMTDEEFERIFGMNKEDFENLSDWKRIELKKQKQLF